MIADLTITNLASCRWCVSGTPISTEIKDFLGQFAFLGVQLFGENAYFNNFVSFLCCWALSWLQKALRAFAAQHQKMVLPPY